MKRKILFTLLFVAIIVVVSGLFMPRANPPVQNKITWDSSVTEEQFRKSCADCHSNETKWPWYAYVGPSAFLVNQNVTEGREHFNISMLSMGDANESSEEVLEGKMPPDDYLLLHPEASLDDSQRRAFADGLKSTFGGQDEEDRERDTD